MLFLVLCGVILAGAVVYGKVTAASFYDDTNVNELIQRSGGGVSPHDNDEYVSTYFNNQQRSVTQLENEAELIVSAKPTRDRINYSNAIRTVVQVTGVIKGSDVKPGDHIFVFEPGSFSTRISSSEFSYYSLGGYNLMREGQEYILLLKHLPKPAGYHYNDEQAMTFMPISSYYAKFPLNSEPGSGYLERAEWDKVVSYDRVKDWDILTSDPNVLQTYRQLKAEIAKSVKP